MKKVLCVIATLSGGGAETHLVDFVLNADRKRYDFTVCCLTRGGPLEARLREAGVRVVHAHKRGRWDVRVYPRLRALIRSADYDLIHSVMFTANLWGWLAVLGTSRRLICEVHNVNPWKRGPYILADRLLSRRAARIITVSRHVAAFLIKRERIAPEKVRIIYNGRDVAAVPYRPPLKGAMRLCVVARLARHKGHALLLRAMAHGKPKMTLQIVGDGEERSELETLASRLGLTERVAFLGYRTDSLAIMADSDVVLLPSEYEGLPLVLIEACGLGRPILASDAPGNDEVVEPGRNGLLFPSGDEKGLSDALLQMDSDRPALGRMARGAREVYDERFRLEMMVAALERVYEEVMAGAK